MRQYHIISLLLLILCTLSACRERITSTLPVATPAYLSTLPGALIYDLDSKDCSQPNAICKQYLLKTGKVKQLSNNLIAAYNNQYNLQDNFEESPNKRYVIQWKVIDKKGVIILPPPANGLKQPIIADRLTGGYHLLNLDEDRSIGGVSNFQWAPDSSHLLYSLTYEPDYADAGTEYLFVIQSTKTGKAYRVFNAPQQNIRVMWTNKTLLIK